MKVGFTGTQHGMTEDQVRAIIKVLIQLGMDEFHHGDCVGADEMAHHVAEKLCVPIVIHPPSNQAKRAFCKQAHGNPFPVTVLPEKPYLDRNHNIVDATDALVAAPRLRNEEQRSGTWATIRYARNLGRPHVIIFPDGTTQRVGL